MKLSTNWLGRYVDLRDKTPEQIRDALTLSTAEVEDIHEFGAGLQDVVVGHVLARAKHPDADKLSVTTVDVGSGEPLQIVCGAPNVAAGQRVVVVQSGQALPDGTKIKRSKIRGVESMGMICSERELGLSQEHEGILVLGKSYTPGIAFARVVPFHDFVLEIDNKSVNHRPDLWGHYGFARELAAIFGRELRPWGELQRFPDKGACLDLRIADTAACPRYCGLSLGGVRVTRSPDWLRWLLHAVDQRSINLLVDLTNFVMLDLGQPLHAFDRRNLKADVAVRFARKGETMRTLDGEERRLEERDLLITSGGEPVALAGVMGGAGSMVREDTSEVFLESATFHAATIRRTSVRLGLRTDSSARFEKTLDPFQAELAVHRFVGLLRELCPGAEPIGPLVDPSGWEFAGKTVRLRRARLDLKLGHVVDDATVMGIFTRLGFGIAQVADGFALDVPSFRASKDVAIEDDLIEEVGRMFRYDNIPERPLVSVVAVPHREAELFLARELTGALALELRANEVFHYSFVPDSVLAAVGAMDQEYASVQNPVAPDVCRVRRHVLPSVLASVAPNLRTRDEVRLFEDGKGYHPETRDKDGLPHEVHELAVVFAGRERDCYQDLRTGIDSLLRRAGYPASLHELLGHAGLPWIHPGRTVALTRGDDVVGYVGTLHPQVAHRLELPSGVAIANLDLRQLLRTTREEHRFDPPSRFPAQPVDVALLVPSGVRVKDCADFLRAVGQKLVRDVRLFEVYRGEGLPPGTKSLNFAVTLGADDRTLTSKDEEKYLNKVRERASEVSAELRG